MKPQPIAPGPGQESVWDYPRPPRVENVSKHITVVFNGETIADTNRAVRVLETSHPPVYYIPSSDIHPENIEPAARSSYCEWKGGAIYHTIKAGHRRAEGAAWSYPNPNRGFEAIRDHVAIYPGRMDACYVDGELVRPQPGTFYGGWITNEIVGPFKGEPGTMGW